ncbi:hypothetical protein [Jiulongibacter sp. NS-SX5]|uniref:hypothetical protein n=1 Tax=Jiulongibacter sp. NS-SX5 TaxID=3463854 RepID=UPI00405A0111
MKKLVFLVLIFLHNLQGHCSTITWDGGAGSLNWSDANNWDSNSLPVAGDDVVINSDSVLLDFSTPVYSSVRIDDAILNIKSNGSLNLSNNGVIGFTITDSSKLYNYGEVSMLDSEGISVYVSFGSIVINFGTFDIQRTPTSPTSNDEGINLFNGAQFLNFLGAEVYIRNKGTFGLFISTSNCVLDNYGYIEITDTNGGLDNNGTLNNYASGEIKINCKKVGLDLFNLSTTTNYGEIWVSGVSEINTSNDAEGIYRFMANLQNNGRIRLNNVQGNPIIIRSPWENHGELIINNSALESIVIDDTLKNSGIITVNQSQNAGIFGDGSSSILQNFGNGEIYVNQPWMSAIYVTEKIDNEGLISVRQSNQYGLYSDSLINNGSASAVKCATGIYVSDFLQNGPEDMIIVDSCNTGINIGGFENRGVVQVSNGTFGKSLERRKVTSPFFNDGILEISSSHQSLYDPLTVSYSDHQNAAHIHNGTNGHIKVLNVTSNTPGLSLKSPLNNEGIIEINGTGMQGIYMQDVIDTSRNSGQIFINNTVDEGFRLSGFMVNSGEIEIDSSGTNGLIVATEGLQNNGRIEIDHTPGTGLGLSSGDNLNSGVIRVKNSLNHGISGSKLINVIGGGVQIINSGNNAISGIKRFINEGIVEIREAGKHGIFKTYHSDSLINYGTIQITDIDSAGIFFDSPNSPLLNIGSGQINISHAAVIGIYTRSDILNESTLDITNTGIGIVQSGSAFTNNGYADIKCPVAIEFNPSGFQDLFNNSRTGMLELEGSLKLMPSPMVNPPDQVNEGYIKQLSGTMPNIFNDFVNDGVYYDQNDSLTAFTSGFTNKGIIIKPQIGRMSQGIKEMDIIHAAAKPAFSVATSWYDPSYVGTFPSSVGTYSPSDDSFKPRGVSAPLLKSLKLTVSHSPLSISHDIIIPVVTKPCTNYRPMNFIGAVSSDWHTPENWDNGRLPDPCSIVTLQNGQTVNIPVETHARTNRFLSEPGSVFESDAGAVLEVLD